MLVSNTKPTGSPSALSTYIAPKLVTTPNARQARPPPAPTLSQWRQSGKCLRTLLRRLVFRGRRAEYARRAGTPRRAASFKERSLDGETRDEAQPCRARGPCARFGRAGRRAEWQRPAADQLRPAHPEVRAAGHHQQLAEHDDGPGHGPAGPAGR